MEDNDNTRGSGRAFGIGINKVRGKGRGKHKTTLSHSSIFQAPRPTDTQPPHYTRQQPTSTQQPHSTKQPTHHLTSKIPSNIQPPQPTRQPTHYPISQTPTNFQPFHSTPSPQMSTIHAPTSQIPTNTQQPHSTRQPTHHLTSKIPSNIQPPQPTRQPTNHPISQTPTNFQPFHSTPSPQMSTIHAPTSQIPTNIQSPHSIPSPHISNTHSPPHLPSGVVSGGDPHASSSCDDSYPTAGSRDPTDMRIWIRPGPQLTFEPAIQPTRDITKIMKRLFHGTWATYGEIKKYDKDLTDLWYKEFQRTYKWLPEHEQEIKQTYHHKAAEGYRNTMYRVRKGIDKGEWIPVELRENLEQNWEDSKWKDNAEVNKQNRRSFDGPMHTCGSIPTTEHSKRLTTDSNMAPSCWEVFQKTHKMKGDPSKWVSSKSQMVAEEYERRIFERNSQQTDGDDVSNDHQSDNIIFLDVVGGVDKKGRIYGLGPEAGKYKPSSSRSSDGISPSEYERMRTVISKMSAENMELKEQLKTHEELIRASQEESRLLREQSQEESRLLREQSQEDSRLLREQLQKFMESFSQGHSHLPPYRPHPSSWDPPLSPS